MHCRTQELDATRPVDASVFASSAPGSSTKYPQLNRLDELTVDQIAERADFRNARRAKEEAACHPRASVTAHNRLNPQL